MTDLFTWIGRLSSGFFLVLIASIVVAAVDGRVRDWREHRRDVKRVRVYGRVWLDAPIPLVPAAPVDGAWCDCGDCARMTVAITEATALEALYALPVYDPEAQR